MLRKLLVLSPDFRGRALSSLLRAASLGGGVAVVFRLGEERKAGVVEVEGGLGVCGLLLGLGRSGIPSSWKRSSGLGGGWLVTESIEEGLGGLDSESIASN